MILLFILLFHSLIQSNVVSFINSVNCYFFLFWVHLHFIFMNLWFNVYVCLIYPHMLFWGNLIQFRVLCYSFILQHGWNLGETSPADMVGFFLLGFKANGRGWATRFQVHKSSLLSLKCVFFNVWFLLGTRRFKRRSLVCYLLLYFFCVAGFFIPPFCYVFPSLHRFQRFVLLS